MKRAILQRLQKASDLLSHYRDEVPASATGAVRQKVNAQIAYRARLDALLDLAIEENPRMPIEILRREIADQHNVGLPWR